LCAGENMNKVFDIPEFIALARIIRSV